MKNSLITLLFLVTSSSTLVAQKPQSWNSGGKLHPLQANMDIRHYTLSLDIDIPNQSIQGFVETDLELKKATDTILFDLIDQLVVSTIRIDNKIAKFTRREDKIFITSDKPIPQGKHKIKIEYGGKPPVAVNPPWQGGFTWTTDKNGKPWVVINCQTDGAKIYFPCKDHPSDEPNEGVDLFVTVPNGLTVAAFGLLQKSNTIGGKTTFHWKTNYTISNYCVLFNIADYQLVSRPYKTILGNIVPMDFYILKQNADKASGVLDIRERDTRILEKYFGEYPWVKEKIGIAQVPNPGMEHQTMITYGDPFNYKIFKGQYYSDNLYHEFAHEWWANKVTNKDWAHMWIQEGIATYAEALCFRELTGEKGYDSLLLHFSKYVENKKPIVQGEEVNSQDTYGRDIYFKGALFMHTLRYVTGDAIFFPTLKKLATDPIYTYDHFVTTDDVEKLFSQASGKNLKPLFDFYLRTTQLLELTVKKVGATTWQIQAKQMPAMTLPLEIVGSNGVNNYQLTNKVMTIESTSTPVVDPGNHYLKKVMVQ
ncbi:MAG: M1 family metallopeptidase [Bacteroidetes bacterium]|nr:M1 family metallopeptidase [Bacteroidota bacterium]